jgi:hypothetical protein
MTLVVRNENAYGTVAGAENFQKFLRLRLNNGLPHAATADYIATMMIAAWTLGIAKLVCLDCNPRHYHYRGA